MLGFQVCITMPSPVVRSGRLIGCFCCLLESENQNCRKRDSGMDVHSGMLGMEVLEILGDNKV